MSSPKLQKILLSHKQKKNGTYTSTTRSTSMKKLNYGLRPYQTKTFTCSVQYAQPSSTKQLLHKIPGKNFECTHLDSRDWISSSEILKYLSVFLSLISKIFSYLCFHVSPCSMSSTHDTLKTMSCPSRAAGQRYTAKEKKKRQTHSELKSRFVHVSLPAMYPTGQVPLSVTR